MKKILFDSDVLIEHVRGNEEVRRRLHELLDVGALLAYTPVTLAEIYRGMRSNEREKTETMLGVMECLEINQNIGKRAGEYMKAYAKTHQLELPDALIAASAVIHRFSLCTFNWKHYPMSDVEKYKI